MENSFTNVVTTSGHNTKNVNFVLLALITLLAPIAFYFGFPTLLFSIKLAVVSTLAILSLIIFLLGVLGTGEIEFPKSNIVLGSLLIVLVSFVSSIFSGNLSQSVVGNVFEIGTSGSMVLMFLVFLLAIVVGLSNKSSKKVVYTLMTSSLVVSLYTILSNFLRKGSGSSSLPASLVGSYVDLAIFMGVSAILAVYLLNFGNLGKKMKVGVWTTLILSMFVVGATSLKEINILMGVLSLVIFVYLSSFFRSHGSLWIKKSYPMLFVLAFSVVLIVSGTTVSGALSNMLGINSFDVRPNVSSTLNVIKGEWSRNPVTGSGPNTFSDLWAMYKPLDVNQSDFWGTSFFFGSGFVPTFLATNGAIGLLALLFFCFFYLKNGFKALFISLGDNDKRFAPVFLFISSLFILIASFIYNPGISTFVLGSVLTGLFVSSLTHLDIVKVSKINIFSNPKANFISVFLIVVCIISSIYGGYVVWEKIVASISFNKAVIAMNNTGNVDAARASIEKVVGIYNSDTYRRALAELHLVNVENIASQIPQNSTSIPDDVRVNLQNSVAGAVREAQAAVDWNRKNYQNHLMFARIYESLAAKGIQGASESARNAYIEVEKLNPFYPATRLALARLDIIENKADDARKNINKAIELKPNYTDAYFLLTQLEVASNNISGAIKAAESATLVDPLNAGLFFQLGLLKYNAGDFAGSGVALENALRIVPEYANAKYFLGLSYAKLGNLESARVQFEDLAKTNPDNADVLFVLENLRKGKSPFADAKPPINPRPERATNPPVEEGNQ